VVVSNMSLVSDQLAVNIDANYSSDTILEEGNLAFHTELINFGLRL
jgi:hypothetical protein